MGTKLQDAASKSAKKNPTGPADSAAVRSADPVKERTDNRVVDAGRAPAGQAVAVLSATSGAMTVGAMDMERDAGMGMEGADSESYALPFIAMLQGLSPQLKTIKGARPGLMLNTVTGDLFEQFSFVPIAFQRRYNRWVPRSQGGGFKGSLTPAEVETLRAQGAAKDVVSVVDGKEVTNLMYDGTQLKDTRNHFVFVLDDGGGWSPALISLASTQIKRSKRLMAMIMSYMKTGVRGKFNPPSFACIYSARSESETNSKGTYESWVFERTHELGEADHELYVAAKGFHAQVTAGQVIVAAPPTGMEDMEDEVDASGVKKF